MELNGDEYIAYYKLKPVLYHFQKNKNKNSAYDLKNTRKASPFKKSREDNNPATGRS